MWDMQLLDSKVHKPSCTGLAIAYDNMYVDNIYGMNLYLYIYIILQGLPMVTHDM
jgi:hypothetical protein